VGRAVVDTGMNLRDVQNEGNFLTNRGTLSF
jgi:hypothetical protein